jgi:hypothetical protein
LEGGKESPTFATITGAERKPVSVSYGHKGAKLRYQIAGYLAGLSILVAVLLALVLMIGAAYWAPNYSNASPLLGNIVAGCKRAIVPALIVSATAIAVGLGGGRTTNAYFAFILILASWAYLPVVTRIMSFMSRFN